MTGAAPSRYGSKLVLAAHVAALLGLSAAAFRNNIDMLFAGMDGVYLLTILEHQFAWLGVAAGFFASPFQGLGDLWFPWNAWLMPAYVLPHLAWGSGAETSASFRVAAFVVAAAELFVAAIVLARTLGMARLPALLGAWLVLLLTMPWSGASLLYPFMMLAPHNATALAESCLLVAALVSLGRASSGAKVSKRDAALVAAIMLLAGHLVLSQPGAVLLCLPVLACVLAGSVAGAETRREAILKLGGSAAAALILVLAGFAVFFIGIYAYSVPRFWPAGLENDRLAWYHVSILFHKTANGWGGPLLFLGGVFGLLHAHSTGERREKRFAGALLVLIAALGIFGAATVYWDFWRGPSPLYVEFFLWPLYAIYAARSLVVGLAWALQRMKRGAALVPFLDRSVAAVALLPLVAALPLVGAASASPLGQRLYFPIPPRETAIVSYLKARVALSPGGEFNGRVATMDALASNDPARWLALHFYFHAPRAAATGNDHAVVGLWHFSIPTLLAYNSSLSPAFFRAATRLLARPEDRQLRSVVVLRKPDARVLGLFGVRYLIADAPQGAPFRLVMTQPTHPKETLHLYEVPVVNLGRLSPLVLNKVEGFERALDALADPRFDPREAALVFEELPGEKLSRATASELRVVPGGFAVKAASAGRTLLVVPFEFSRCLSVRSLDKALPAPQLVRVDALLTGVLFERGVDAEVRYFTGPFDGAGCRLRDGADLKRLLSMKYAEQAALVGLAFFLPLYEAPKNVLWLAFVALWLVNRVRARDFGGRWDGWDTLIVLWIASGFAAAAFAGIHGDEWRAAADILRYGGVLWMLKRSRYDERTWRALLAALFAGTVVALAWSYWSILVAGTTELLTLNSVGHINHSAVYASIVLGVAVIALRAGWASSGWALRALGLALVTLLAVSVMWMQSRAAAGAAFVMALVLLVVYTARRRGSFRGIAIAAALAVGVTLALKPQVLEKNTRMIQEGKFLNVRDGAWRVGLAAFREFPLFGVGMDNYGRIDAARVQGWRERRGEAFDKDAYLFTSHGHSLYVNTLAERGIVGLAVLLGVLGAWAFALFRRLPAPDATPLAWTYWGGACAAWIAAVLEGAVTTTLHHEHALISMLLLGAWLSLSKKTPAS